MKSLPSRLALLALVGFSAPNSHADEQYLPWDRTVTYQFQDVQYISAYFHRPETESSFNRCIEIDPTHESDYRRALRQWVSRNQVNFSIIETGIHQQFANQKEELAYLEAQMPEIIKSTTHDLFKKPKQCWQFLRNTRDFKQGDYSVLYPKLLQLYKDNIEPVQNQ